MRHPSAAARSVGATIANERMREERDSPTPFLDYFPLYPTGGPWPVDPAAPRQEPTLAAFIPTPENVNALPEPLRRYIHDLQTDCDPSGTIRENVIARETITSLEILLTESREIATKYEDRYFEARQEIALDDQLLADRDRILDACPCPAHGRCVPYVLEQLAGLPMKGPKHAR